MFKDNTESTSMFFKDSKKIKEPVVVGQKTTAPTTITKDE